MGQYIRVTYDYIDGNGASEEVLSDLAGPVEAAELPIFVPAHWSLVPSGLDEGDRFRLLFLSSEARNAVPTAIDTYNTWVQDLAAAGHTSIRRYSSAFRIVGSTEDVDARDNTDTTGSGVPIYWLNGDKAADDYADFYDGSWDQEATMRTEAGASVSAPSSVWTGSNHNGTERGSRALGESLVSVGKPNSAASGHGPLSSSDSGNRTSSKSVYALSGVFQVASIIPVCLRTPQVRDAIVAVSGVSDCADVTREHLRSITSLDLSGQGITTLKDFDFADLDLVKTLDLSNNSLTSIPTDGRFHGVSSHHYSGTFNGAQHFRGYAPLRTLDLSDNQISSLPISSLPLDNDGEGGFYWLKRLENLDLSGNSLTSLPERAFEQRHSNSLRVLDLSDNALSSIEASSTVLGSKDRGTFYNLGALQTLDLSGNNLTNLANGTFMGPVWLGTWTGPSLSLKTLDLSDNGMVTAPRKLWDNDCNSNVPNLTITPGNPDLTTCLRQVWTATMTVGEGEVVGVPIFGWDSGTTLDGDVLTDADFVHKNETYAFRNIVQGSTSLTITIDGANSGSIDDAAVRKVMTLYVDGAGFPLKDAAYMVNSAGDHNLRWNEPGFDLACWRHSGVGDMGEEVGMRRAGEAGCDRWA